MPSKTKRKKRAKGVDYGFATQTARDFIQLYNVDWLPGMQKQQIKTFK